ncbi:retinoschisin-like [Mizuhopecten yessoensis]|nr:retinoschisin-like [Mizuhopecten yessoensis]
MTDVLRSLSFLTIVSLCLGSSPTCNNNLVTGPDGVSDAAITASSTYRTCPVHMARINSDSAWCPNSRGDDHYLQVEFQYVTILKAILTRGRKIADQWVSSYKVSISLDGLIWRYLLNSTGGVQVFPGNVDRNTVVTNELKGTVVAKFIRVISVTGNGYRSMRLEVRGCPIACSRCHHWEARLGSTGDVLPVLVDIDASNQGMCGLKCFRQPECDSFLFDVTSARCMLFKGTVDGSHVTVNLDGVWYFLKTRM